MVEQYKTVNAPIAMPVEGLGDESHEKIEDIVDQLNSLRSDAKRTGCEEISTMVDACFDLCYTTYYLILRNSLSNDLESAE